MYRRKLLQVTGGTALVASSGCIGGLSARNDSTNDGQIYRSFILRNESKYKTNSVSIELSRKKSDKTTSWKTYVSAGSMTIIEDIVDSGGEYDVLVVLNEKSQQTSTWKIPDEGNLEIRTELSNVRIGKEGTSGFIEAERVKESPQSIESISVDDERIEDSKLLLQTINKAARSGSAYSRTISGQEFFEVEKTLHTIPRYEGEYSGYYFHVDDTVIEVGLSIRQ